MKRPIYLVLTLCLAFTLAGAGSADAKAKIKFNYPNALDAITVGMRGIPESQFDPDGESFVFAIMNVAGFVCSEALPPSSFVLNRKGTAWRYGSRRNGLPKIFRATIKPKPNRVTQSIEYVLKVKAVANADLADPSRNSQFAETELDNMLLQIHVGADAFYLTENWQRLPRNTDKPLSAWKLAAKYVE